MLMTGGSGGESSMKSTERLNPKSLQWTSGSQLPESLYGHCVVSINDTTILIIGGGKIVEGSDKTFFFHNDGTYTVRSISILVFYPLDSRNTKELKNQKLKCRVFINNNHSLVKLFQKKPK